MLQGVESEVSGIFLFVRCWRLRPLSCFLAAISLSGLLLESRGPHPFRLSGNAHSTVGTEPEVELE